MPSAEADDRERGTRFAACLTASTRWICYLAIFLILLLPLPVLYEIIADQVDQPPVWVFETTGYLIIMIAFAASGYGLSTGHHFRISLLSEKVPALARPLARLSGALEALFGMILLIAGTMQAYGAFEQDLRSDTLLQVPQVWPMLAFPIGGLAILLQGLSHVVVPRVRDFRP